MLRDDSVITRRRFGALSALGLLAVGCSTAATAGGPAARSAQTDTDYVALPGQAVAQPAAQTIQVQMGEFSYTPKTIRLKAGQTATLTFSNKGAIGHEVMIGRRARAAGGYEQDFFHDLDVQANGTKYEWNPKGHGEAAAGEHAEAGQHGQNETAQAQEAKHGAAEPAGHSGAALEVQPGGQATLTFKVPAERKGTWEIGCFEPGHYQAGMKGTLIVE